MAQKHTYILFDLDGTLTDPYEGITKSVQYSLRPFGIEAKQEELTKFIGPPMRDSYRDYYGLNPEQTQAAIAKYRERFQEVGLYENELYDGICEMLQALKNDGRILAVASSKPQVFVERILDYFHITEPFTCICGSYLDGRRTEKVEVVEAVIEMLHIQDRSEALLVGDRIHDVVGAKKAGIECVGAAYGYGGRQELEEAGAVAVADTVAELQELLLQM